MAYTTIDDPSAYFQIALYTGNDSSNAITNDGNSDLQPDWLWTKNRSSSADHKIFDSTRGVTKFLESNTNDAEGTQANLLSSFNSDGFTLGAGGETNSSSTNYVAWQWKANGGSRTTFTESGNNPAGGHQANTTAGFSIVDYTGTGSAGTVSHGLGAVPHLIIVKRRNSSDSWRVYHKDLGLNGSYPNFLQLDLQDANESGDSGNFTATPSSTVFSIGNYSVLNTDGSTYIAYAFTEKQGYSKFGSYTGNGNADGPFVYTGFKPAWFLVKSTNQSNQQWYVFDNKRDTINPVTRQLQPNLNDAENNVTNSPLDFLSNGIKIRNTSGHDNTNNGGYIYMAFAESPFVSSEGVPTTAK
jgi:hypothetical protein